MIFLRLLNPQGIAGLTVATILSLLLAVQAADTRHWKKQSARFETLAGQAQSALDLTAARVRAAAAEAEAGDRRNADRVRIQQAAITKDITDEYEDRLADARARAQRLRVENPAAPAAAGRGAGANVPDLSDAPGGIAQTAGKNRFPSVEHRAQAEVAPIGSDDALTATEQAIQLDTLIQWVRKQAAVDLEGNRTDQSVKP